MNINEFVIDSDLFKKISSDIPDHKDMYSLIRYKVKNDEFYDDDIKECFDFHAILNAILLNRCILAYNEITRDECSVILEKCPIEIQRTFNQIIGRTALCRKITDRMDSKDTYLFEGTTLESKIPYLDVAYNLPDNKIVASTKKDADYINKEHIVKLNAIEVTYADVQFLKDAIENGIPYEKQFRNWVVILTALPVEYKAIKSHLNNCINKVCVETLFEIGQFVTKKNRYWNVAIAQIGAHNSSAALQTERASLHFKPEIILFVGVAGGIKNVSVGDIVAVTKAYDYEFGKLEANAFKARPDAPESNSFLVQIAQKVARDEEWINRVTNSDNQSYKAIIGPIASGEKVVASSEGELCDLVNFCYNDALAFDEESHGFLRAANTNRNLIPIVIRGISDKLDGKSKSDNAGSQEIASRNAAAFAFELISEYDFNKEQ